MRVGDVLCVGALGVWAATSLVFTLLTAVLLAHPLLHVILGGSTSALVTAGAYVGNGRMSLAVVVPLAVVGVAMFDPVFWWAGHHYGDRLTRALVRHRALKYSSVVRGERWARRFGGQVVLTSYFLPIPNMVVYAAVGASGMPLWQFLLLDAVAALLWIGLLVGLGYGIGAPAIHAANAVSHYALWITLGIAVVLAVVFARRRLWTTPRSS